MRTVGIIAEYNPLHNGHVYHIDQAKKLTGAKYCIVVLSGNFVQRGEAACANKFERAEWAVRAGADLVLELPSVYALSSAERFALGGIRTLAATGIVTDLAFGCESEDVQTLYRLCELLMEDPPNLRAAMKRHLSMGKSYPRARCDALRDYGVSEEMLAALTKPNNILAIEYLRGLRACAPDIRPVPVTRIGGEYHSETLSGAYSSATAIRAALRQRDRAVLDTMPLFVGASLFYDTHDSAADAIGPMALYALRNLPASKIAMLPDVGEGFENVLLKAVKRVSTIDELYGEIKSKRYTMARCKRIVLSALLGLTAEQVYATVRSDQSVYLHALAFAAQSRQLLSGIAKRPHAPLLLRQADLTSAPPIVQRNCATDALATDIYAYAAGCEIRRDFQGAVVI